MIVPFSVKDPEDASRVTLVLGVSFPWLLLGPAQGDTKLRWVNAHDCDFARVYFDQPWHAPFSAVPAPPADHAH